MPELLRILDLSPAAEWLAVALICAFALVKLAHQVIGLLEAWDEYRVNRPEMRRPQS